MDKIFTYVDSNFEKAKAILQEKLTEPAHVDKLHDWVHDLKITRKETSQILAQLAFDGFITIDHSFKQKTFMLG